MKRQIKKWTFRLMVTGLFLFGLLVMFMLNPVLLYANKTSVGNYSIYHNKPLEKNFLYRLQQADSIIQSSELYNQQLKMDICLKDGSKYPGLIEKILGKDPLTTFYNKIAVTGDEVNYDSNYIKFDGHTLNFTAMLAHVQVHCLQFKKYGFWKSNPVAKHPKWKWEGYPEYIARQYSDVKTLKDNIQTLLQAEQANSSWVTLSDHTEIVTGYFKYRLLVQYCLEVKKISFIQLIEDTTPEEIVREQMMGWYKGQYN
jgi:hypothetical protein